MGYVITGVVCLVVGALFGILGMALCVASRNNEYIVEDRQHKEDEQ